jgi:DNA-binding response OmpR family regulator
VSPAPVGADAPVVLLVDDDRMVLFSTKLVLQASGFRVVAVDRGVLAVDAAKRERPDVILLDIMMPEMDGWETLSRIRAETELHEIPVLIFTAREHHRGRRVARELGAVDYVPKPYDAEKLVQLCRTHADANRRRLAAAGAGAQGVSAT